MHKNNAVSLKWIRAAKTNWPGWRALMAFVFLTGFCGASVSPLAAKTEEKRQNDLAAFFHDADICQYLSGEWDSTLPQKRKNELSRKINKTCFDIYKRQESLKRKYQGNKSITQKLESYNF